MRIGELSERTGIACSRIRFYERIGLLKAVTRQPNGYRTYPPEAEFALDLITAAQQAGFSLDEIGTLLPPDLTCWEHGLLLDRLRQKVLEIEALEARMAQSKAHLLSLVGQIEGKPRGMDCATNARRVLTQMRKGMAAGRPPTGRSMKSKPQ
ncbi:MerR family transcriptional regulator [Caballeronia ptereochthonis]|uniref:MerR family transcriptional regulator n=1 Tax=Caballeronia ptereochthonis TaxID=1777144 RepID=A0A158AYH8_9BURK|nr:MerR family transcriptional regulator [Caballeronia ptereochthonis]SAK62882.1 MerR family transcriptional regulator [Caballeronia ptereochthonis]